MIMKKYGLNEKAYQKLLIAAEKLKEQNNEQLKIRERGIKQFVRHLEERMLILEQSI